MIDDRCLLYHEMYVCSIYHFLPQELVLTDLIPKIQVFSHDVTSDAIQTVKATSQLGDPRVTYNLEDGMVPETNMPVRFYLSPNREDGSASILVSEPLDYETTPFFSLQVRAQNVAAVPLAAFTRVYVNVTGTCLAVFVIDIIN